MSWKDVERNATYKVEYRKSKKDKAVAYKGGVCCNCKQSFPSCVFDFHHTDPKTKTQRINKFMDSKWEIIKKELDKCVLLCSNCHRLEHYYAKINLIRALSSNKGKNMNDISKQDKIVDPRTVELTEVVADADGKFRALVGDGAEVTEGEVVGFVQTDEDVPA